MKNKIPKEMIETIETFFKKNIADQFTSSTIAYLAIIIIILVSIM